MADHREGNTFLIEATIRLCNLLDREKPFIIYSDHRILVYIFDLTKRSINEPRHTSDRLSRWSSHSCLQNAANDSQAIFEFVAAAMFSQNTTFASSATKASLVLNRRLNCRDNLGGGVIDPVLPDKRGRDQGCGGDIDAVAARCE